MTSTEHTDVLVCGAGPVGLLTALGLSQQGIDTFLIGLSFSNTIVYVFHEQKEHDYNM